MATPQRRHRPPLPDGTAAPPHCQAGHDEGGGRRAGPPLMSVAVRVKPSPGAAPEDVAVWAEPPECGGARQRRRSAATAATCWRRVRVLQGLRPRGRQPGAVPRAAGPGADRERLRRRERDALRLRADGEREDAHHLRLGGGAGAVGVVRAGVLPGSGRLPGKHHPRLLLRGPRRHADRPRQPAEAHRAGGPHQRGRRQRRDLRQDAAVPVPDCARRPRGDLSGPPRRGAREPDRGRLLLQPELVQIPRRGAPLRAEPRRRIATQPRWAPGPMGVTQSTIGALTLVDLAGTEKEHENPSVQGKKSARLLNTSLSSLNRLLRKLQTGSLDESERRQSVLNKCLWEYLRPGCGIAMVFCVSPLARHRSITLSTLAMATDSKLIHNQRKSHYIQIPAQSQLSGARPTVQSTPSQSPRSARSSLHSPQAASSGSRGTPRITSVRAASTGASAATGRVPEFGAPTRSSIASSRLCTTKHEADELRSAKDLEALAGFDLSCPQAIRDLALQNTTLRRKLHRVRAKSAERIERAERDREQLGADLAMTQQECESLRALFIRQQQQQIAFWTGPFMSMIAPRDAAAAPYDEPAPRQRLSQGAADAGHCPTIVWSPKGSRGEARRHQPWARPRVSSRSGNGCTVGVAQRGLAPEGIRAHPARAGTCRLRQRRCAARGPCGCRLGAGAAGGLRACFRRGGDAAGGHAARRRGRRELLPRQPSAGARLLALRGQRPEEGDARRGPEVRRQEFAGRLAQALRCQGARPVGLWGQQHLPDGARERRRSLADCMVGHRKRAELEVSGGRGLMPACTGHPSPAGAVV
ncbi:unnamed protein product [Prorocentrum cordatum]|uniref:Kinesin motor domain-containing protein n=1 Tax=Prorocentrum cordatum TaxID=2364126 RepID=A0ABN9TQY5_9DINO|nr:unnamed protein product [Polarella glacialis]